MFKVEKEGDTTVVSSQIRAKLDDDGSFGVEWMKLYVALHAFSAFLREQGLAPEYGPVAPAIVFPPELFNAFRDKATANPSLASLFTLPRRKRPNMTLRRTMLAGVALVSLEALPDHYLGAFSPCRTVKRQPDPIADDDLPF